MLIYYEWCAAVGCLGAADESVNYSARPTLAEVVLGGCALSLQLDPQGEVGGEAAYLGLSLRPGELPLEINLRTAPTGKAPVVRLRSRLEGFQAEWEDHDSQMYLVLRFLDRDNRAVSSATFIRVEGATERVMS